MLNSIRTPIDDLSILCHHDLVKLSRDLLEQRDFTRAGVRAILHEIEHGASAVVVRNMLQSMVEEMESIERAATNSHRKTTHVPQSICARVSGAATRCFCRATLAIGIARSVRRGSRQQFSRHGASSSVGRSRKIRSRGK